MDSIPQIIKAKWAAVLIILAIAVALAILAVLFPQLWQGKPLPKEAVPSDLDELDDLRRQSGDQAPVSEETQQQFEELDKLQEQSQQALPTEADIEKQLEELDALRVKSTQ